MAFQSQGTNLVAGFVDGNGGFADDVYARDMSTAAAGSTVLVSAAAVGGPGNGGNGDSNNPRIAGDAAALNQLKVAYNSSATDIDDPVANPDTAANESVYLRNFGLAPAASILVSRVTGAAGANADSRAHVAGVSADGNRITFASDADNLRPGPGYYAAYMRDLTTNKTVMVGDNYEYVVRLAVSADGRYAAWSSAGTPTSDADPYVSSIYGRTIGAGSIASLGAYELLSRPPGNVPYVAPGVPVQSPDSSGAKFISADGRYVVFTGPADRLAGAPNLTDQVMRRDIATGQTVIVSRRNGAAGATTVQSSREPAISDDGNRVAFLTREALDAADTNGVTDVYLRDVTAGTTVLVSRAPGAAGAIADSSSSAPRLSGDGNRVLFRTDAGNLGVPGGSQHLFVRDLGSHQTIMVDRADGAGGSVGDRDAGDATISADGQRVAFTSGATNLDPDDADLSQDLFLRDLGSSQTTLVSRRPGAAGSKLSSARSPAISGNGLFVAFETADSNAAPGTGVWASEQIVRRDLTTGANVLVSRAAGGGPAGNRSSEQPTLSGDGSRVAFLTEATNLLGGIGGELRTGLVVSDLSGGGALSGPPAFGLLDNRQGVDDADISADGRCVNLFASGHNAATGPLGDWPTSYVHVVEGDCHMPEPVPVPSRGQSRPVLSRVSLKPKKFAVGKKRTARVASAEGSASAKGRSGKKRAGKKKRVARGTTIRFRLNTRATVRIGFQKRVLGLKVKVTRKAKRAGAKGKFTCRKAPARKVKRAAAKKRCPLWKPVGSLARRNRAGGRLHKVKFSGRVDRTALKPGRYRAVLKARNDAGTSKPVRRPFRVVRG